jgi:hypothetical protein
MLPQLRLPFLFHRGRQGTGCEQEKQRGGDKESPPPQRIATWGGREHGRHPKF